MQLRNGKDTTWDESCNLSWKLRSFVVSKYAKKQLNTYVVFSIKIEEEKIYKIIFSLFVWKDDDITKAAKNRNNFGNGTVST